MKVKLLRNLPPSPASHRDAFTGWQQLRRLVNTTSAGTQTNSFPPGMLDVAAVIMQAGVTRQRAGPRLGGTRYGPGAIRSSLWDFLPGHAIAPSQ